MAIDTWLMIHGWRFVVVSEYVTGLVIDAVNVRW